MKREYYSDSISNFINSNTDEIIGKLTRQSEFAVEISQRRAWEEEISILRKMLTKFNGHIYFEYSIPRMGQRVDVIVIIGPVLFVLEFKTGEKKFHSHAIDQVWDYALDLKNFHETSHNQYIVPVLIATEAKKEPYEVKSTPRNDKLLYPISCNPFLLEEVISKVLSFADGADVDHSEWESGHYCPTPTIIEAAISLYNNHSVEDISRRDASAINLSKTSKAISEIIRCSKLNGRKSICFVTGVPGSGKTLVGLDIATTHIDKSNDLYSVFLSGNGPLVKILREALVRDKVRRKKECGKKIKKKEAFSEVKAFIQNVHNFRDDCIADSPSAPIEHVTLFDEAQRAWDINKTSDFMKRRKGISNFNRSEPEFLISCLDRHQDWAVIVCLVGGGQEIHTGEAGISEWIESLNKTYQGWDIYLSSRITDSEYETDKIIKLLQVRPNVSYKDELHLGVSMRSYRAENVSLLIKQLLDLDKKEARKTLERINRYPIIITRNLKKAKQWLKRQARGSERYGIVVSSQAERLKPHAIDVKSPMDPIHWFLNGKDDVRSSYYLEHVATEFQIQGLELDWVCVTWDADFRFSNDAWDHWSFSGSRWNKIRKDYRKNYLKNAYRVLLTRARQGMIIVVPSGDSEDVTRLPEFYDGTYNYLKYLGFSEM